MKHINTIIGLGVALLLTSGLPANASAGEAPAGRSEKPALEAQPESEYEKALFEAERQRLEAEASLKSAREQLKAVAEQRAQSSRQTEEARAAERAEMAKMHEELNRARRQLLQTSREIARVNQEVARAQAERHTANFVVRTSEKPVIGVILGEAKDGGVKVLGVSPDGPSERAGIRPGDTIIAVNGRELSTIDETGDARDALGITLHDIKADEPVVVTVRRENAKVDMTVVPEVREPLTWQTITRFPSVPAAPASASSPEVPAAPEKVVTVEHIVVPEIDTIAIAEKIEQMRAGIEKRRAVNEVVRATSEDGTWEIEIDELSEFGSLALEDANIWFGLPLAQGLRLAEIGSGLGKYFKTDRGVLVLKARAGNDLKLEPGDVILQVGDTEVNTPAEFMRALRGIDPGDELVMDIKRDRKDRTLKTVVREESTSFLLEEDSTTHTLTITSSSH